MYRWKLLFTVMVALLGALFSNSQWTQAQPIPLPLAREHEGLVERQKLVAADGGQEHYFGRVVDMSSDGSTVLVGAPGADSRRGAAYVYARSGDSWSLQQKLFIPDGGADDQFGYFAALSDDGSTAVIGAYEGTIVYIFTRSGEVWTLVDQLSENSLEDDRYGNSIGINADASVIFVGAHAEQVGLGAVYVYTRSGNDWNFAQKLVLPGNPYPAYSGFGYSIALRGSTALISAVDFTKFTDVVFAFAYNGAQWVQGQMLEADPDSDGNVSDFFGWSMALDHSGTTALISEWGADEPQISSGAVYFFTNTGGVWSRQQKLTLPGGEAYDSFGWSVDLTGDGSGALISASGDDANRGSVYYYTRTETNWVYQQQLVASDGLAPDKFGSAVAISADGEIAAAGMEGDELLRGAAYMFMRAHPVDTPTPTGTAETPAPTSTSEAPTPTPAGSANLLLNASFEAKDGVGQPALDPWKFKGDSKDKVRCGQTHKLIAHEGQCAFRFKGSAAGENSRISQKVNVNDPGLEAGDVLSLKVYASANSPVTDAEITIRVKYTDGTGPGKTSIFVSQTNGYAAFAGSATLASAAVKNVRVRIDHQSVEGKLWIDNVSLTVNP
jgi:hypothetical protein